MKKWIMSALLAGFVVSLVSCSNDCQENGNRGCKRCSPSKRCTSLVTEKVAEKKA